MTYFNPQPKPEPRQKKKPGRIKKNSAKQIKRLRKYSTARKAYLEAVPFCEVRSCSNKSDQVHHQKGRIGKLLWNDTYFLAVCHDCHRKIEDHPDWAKSEGYSLERYEQKLAWTILMMAGLSIKDLLNF